MEKTEVKLKEIKKGTKGITLIALVVTIIVLLILAGISIQMLTGENGILKRATQARKATDEATEQEQRDLAKINAMMSEENEEYTDKNGDKAMIPAGFALTERKGESTVKEGLVITDAEGNEFVWIPCTVKTDTEETQNSTDLIDYDAGRDEKWIDEQVNYNGGTWGDSQAHTIGISSVKKYKGFYIGRYEAGIPEEAPFYPKEENEYKDYTSTIGEDKITKNTNQYIPVTKKGVPVWNWISQNNAKTVAENMIKNNGVQSYLIDSNAWDTACRAIEKYDSSKKLLNSIQWGNYTGNDSTKYEKLNCLYAIHTLYKNKDNWAWKYAESYNNGYVTDAPKGEGEEGARIELSTGASDDFKAYNIYDLAGNLWELTTENGQRIINEEANEKLNKADICGENDYGTTINIVRGGGFSSVSGGRNVVCRRMNNNLGSFDFGFRVVLYIK